MNYLFSVVFFIVEGHFLRILNCVTYNRFHFFRFSAVETRRPVRTVTWITKCMVLTIDEEFFREVFFPLPLPTQPSCWGCWFAGRQSDQNTRESSGRAKLTVFITLRCSRISSISGWRVISFRHAINDGVGVRSVPPRRRIIPSSGSLPSNHNPLMRNMVFCGFLVSTNLT